jgi:hypothetical protein
VDYHSLNRDQCSLALESHIWSVMTWLIFLSLLGPPRGETPCTSPTCFLPDVVLQSRLARLDWQMYFGIHPFFPLKILEYFTSLSSCMLDFYRLSLYSNIFG